MANYQPKMIAVSVDSMQGSIVQAEIIANAVSDKAKEIGCPLYTFAEAGALGSGYLILAAGDKAHADPHSLIGGISSSFQGIGLVNALKMLKIQATMISTAENRLSPFEELKEKDEKWIMHILQHQDSVMKNIISKNRKQVAVWNK